VTEPVPDAELVARAEHELRGAAAALALACDALRRDPVTGPHAAMIDAQLDRLRAGLEDLEAARGGRPRVEKGGKGAVVEDLEVARGGGMEPTRVEGAPEGRAAAPEPVEVAALARAASRPWATSFEWEGGPAPANIDRRRFAKALGNVLANAAKHGSGEVRVTGRAHEGGVRLQVRNRGRGLTIASEAAQELGGSLSFEIVDDTAVATLDLPAG
jgi:signal transduction histidine kinase